MNNNILVSKKDELTKNAESIAAKSAELDTQIQKLLAEKEQLKRNFDATSGALQLLEVLMKEYEVVDAPKLEIVD